MISQSAEYALRAMVYLASHGEAPRTVAQIAAEAMLPAGYLAKLLQGLSRAKIVKSQRGLNGGYSLAGRPDELTVLQVVNAVDPLRRFPECPLGIASHGRRLCPLHRRLDDAAQVVEAAFAATTVADLLPGGLAPGAACAFPAASTTRC